MFNFSDISLSLSLNGFYLFLGILFTVVYVYFYYKNTIPAIDKSLKILLSFLRLITLACILFLIFEPLLHYKLREEIKPKSLIFFDNSSSIIAKDSSSKKEFLSSVLTKIKDETSGDIEIFTFGKSINSIEKYGLKFNESITNFAEIVNFAEKQSGNIASINIISDGIITDGSNPINSALKLGIPINILAIGDTISEKDAYISKIITNEYLYTKTNSNVEVTINNINLANQTTKILLFEDGKLITSKEVILSQSGIDKVNFDYIPSKTGDVKLTASVSAIKTEQNKSNNTFIKFVKVLDSKVNIAIISSLPTPDVSFIKNSLYLNENYDIKLIQQAGTIFIGNTDNNKILDSADILILINFPTVSTSNDLLNKTINKIESGKPFLFVLGENIDFNKLKLFEKYLPFSIKSFSNSKLYVQAFVNDNNSSLIRSNNQLFTEIWSNLPPVLRNSGEFISKPESQILLKAKIANSVTEMPLLISKSLGKKRTIAILASEIWRWKLNSIKESETVFDGLLSESVKWLNVVTEQKQLSVKTSKQIYGKGESIEFIASAYDESFNPIDFADIKIKAQGKNNEYETVFESIGNGIYKATLNIPHSGYYAFTATGNIKGKDIGKDIGRFSIGEIDLEKINLKQNKDLLLSLSGNTGGIYFESNDYGKLINQINNSIRDLEKYTYKDNEIKLWNLEFLLLLLILLFAFEWILRKKSGLL